MKKLLLIALIPVAAIASVKPHVEVAQQLAHGISSGDQILIGNALAQLRSLACQGDPNASVLLGKKYFSGNEEFTADPLKAERYLKHAAENGVKGAAVMLVMHYLKVEPTKQSLEQAAVWLRVAQVEEGVGSPALEIAKSGLEVALLQNEDLSPDQDVVAKEGALSIHRIRNGLVAGQPGPCSGWG